MCRADLCSAARYSAPGWLQPWPAAAAHLMVLAGLAGLALLVWPVAGSLRWYSAVVRGNALFGAWTSGSELRGCR